MMNRIVMILLAAVMGAAAVSAAEPADVTVSAPGSLRETLGDRLLLVDSLVVRGPVDEADFETMWEATFSGSLDIINLEYAQVKDKKIPDFAFYYPDRQSAWPGFGYYMIGLKRIIFPDDIEEIGLCAFELAGNLEEINVPKSLRRLGGSCFESCKHLKTSPLVFPEGFEELGEECLANTYELNEIVLPGTVRTIPDRGLRMCGAKRVTLPESLTSIGYLGFSGAFHEEVTIPENCLDLGAYCFQRNYLLKKMSLPEGIRELPEGFVYDCYELTSVNIPSTVEKISKSALEGTFGLESVNLPEGLHTLGALALSKSGIKEVMLPSTLTYIDRECFKDASKLERIYSKSAVPPQCYTDTDVSLEDDPTPFEGIDKNIPVYIPVGSKMRYRLAIGWSYFTNFIETAEFPDAGVDAAVADSGIRVYSEGGRVVIETQSSPVQFVVCSADGRVIRQGTVSAGAAEVYVGPGVYIVRAAAETVKLIVR